MPDLLEKAEELHRLEGCVIWSTTDRDLAFMIWDDPAVGRLANGLNRLLREHALSTNLVECRGETLMVVRLLELLPYHLVARSGGHETAVEIHNQSEVEIAPERLDMMQDAAQHAARSLRAHLAPQGISEVLVTLSYGITPKSDCVLQVINPLQCDFGSHDYGKVSNWLGGDPA